MPSKKNPNEGNENIPVSRSSQTIHGVNGEVQNGVKANAASDDQMATTLRKQDLESMVKVRSAHSSLQGLTAN